MYRVEEQGTVAQEMEEGVSGEVRVAYHGEARSACAGGGCSLWVAGAACRAVVLSPGGHRYGVAGRDRTAVDKYHQRARTRQVAAGVELSVVGSGFPVAVLRRVDEWGHGDPRDA